MSYYMELLLFILICVKQEAQLGIASHKFVYQKDMSEYCRRRVMPSVFLGRQVVGAYSQILHFSRVELPYSCFISIRTETGSNIILVIQLMSNWSLAEACSVNKNQLLVYEIGETFGGYWGPLPDNVIKHETTKNTKPYTLLTTQPTTASTTRKRHTTPSTAAPTTIATEDLKTTRRDRKQYIQIEVPLVNVSARLVPGDLRTNTSTDEQDEERFDMMFDFTPRPDASYQTKLLPLVQFSIADEISAKQTGEEIRPAYEVDFNSDIFTPDPRLQFPLHKGKKYTNHYSVNKLINFQKNKKHFAEKEALFKKNSRLHLSSFRPPLNHTRPNDLLTRPYDFMKPPKHAVERTPNSWELIEDILKNLNKSKEVATTIQVDKHVADLLHGLSKMNNDSVFSVSNVPQYTYPANTYRPFISKHRTDSITWSQPPASYRINYLDEVDDTSKFYDLSQSEDTNESFTTLYAVKYMNTNDSVNSNDGATIGTLMPLTLDIDSVILNATYQNMEKYKNPPISATEVRGTTTTSTTPQTVKPLTLVDHESWENMVHAASLMEVMLNQSAPSTSENEREKNKLRGLNVRQTKHIRKKRRKKRYIHAIPIEHARPHHLPHTVEVPTSTEQSEQIGDAHEFQRLIELQDDEIHDRVALRYLRQYVGPALFNICDFRPEEAAARHVYLFNSSRLVLAISNFTMERMTVVMTPARTLLTSDARCSAAQLECQVSGARICIDSLNACDGVPNCGSYDIYDEDRLACGASVGLQHNVCLAALTFLAVLLTLLYTVHYWLKRCVPKVSDAFFIYTDAAENVLYLDSIMRSPHDNEEDKSEYRDHDYLDYLHEKPKRNTIDTLFHRILTRFGRKRQKRSREFREEIMYGAYADFHPDSRLYSFGEEELRKIVPAYSSDVAVQTGSSLEMKNLGPIRIDTNISLEDSEEFDIIAHYEGKPRLETLDEDDDKIASSDKRQYDELSLVKFFRKARSVSMQVSYSEEELANKDDISSSYITPIIEEEEIQVLELDKKDESISLEKGSNKPIRVSDGKPVHISPLVTKRLRFNEDAKEEKNEEIGAEEEFLQPRRSLAPGTGKALRGDNNSDSSIDNAEIPSTSANREFKSYFWSSKSKGKKPIKKKTQLSLR